MSRAMQHLTLLFKGLYKDVITPGALQELRLRAAIMESTAN